MRLAHDRPLGGQSGSGHRAGTSEPGAGGAARRRALHRRLLSVRGEAGLPEEVSALRVFDVIAWMGGENRGLGEGSDLER